METKTFEVRDRGTFMPILAVRIAPGDERERWLLCDRAGFSPDGSTIMLLPLDGGSCRAECDPCEWPPMSRTLPAAHRWITNHWNALENGSVIDVEYILDEKPSPKVTEQFWSRVGD